MKINNMAWRAALPKAENIAGNVQREVTKAVVAALEHKAQEWASENKLLHVGAAQKLANELKQKLNERTQ